MEPQQLEDVSISHNIAEQEREGDTPAVEGLEIVPKAKTWRIWKAVEALADWNPRGFRHGHIQNLDMPRGLCKALWEVPRRSIR